MAYGPWTPAKVEKFQKIAALEPTSLNHQVFGVDGKGEEVGDLIAMPDSTLDGAHQGSLKKVVEQLLAPGNRTLKEAEKRVLALRYGIGCDDKTLEEVGSILKVTRERVRQIEVLALRKAKSALSLMGLEKDTI